MTIQSQSHPSSLFLPLFFPSVCTIKRISSLDGGGTNIDIRRLTSNSKTGSTCHIKKSKQSIRPVDCLLPVVVSLIEALPPRLEHQQHEDTISFDPYSNFTGTIQNLTQETNDQDFLLWISTQREATGAKQSERVLPIFLIHTTKRQPYYRIT